MHIEIKKRLSIKKPQGFTLIELLIAIPISMLVLFAVLKIFTNSIQSAHTQTAFGRVQENGRMATELMARDIRGADYWGCMNNFPSVSNNLDTTDSDYNTYILDMMATGGVVGADNVSSTTVSGTSVIDGTDTLTLSGTQGLSNVSIDTPYMTANSSTIHISTSSGIEVGDLILISDCENADLFTNTSGNTDTSGSLGHNQGNVTVTGAVNNTGLNLSTTYDNSAQILIPYVKTYFIAANTSGGNSLYQSVNSSVSELVRGITDLQIMYGEDTTGDGSADTYSNAGSVTDMNNVLTIRVSLTSDSSSDESATALQRIYTVTSNIRNRTL